MSRLRRRVVPVVRAGGAGHRVRREQHRGAAGPVRQDLPRLRVPGADSADDGAVAVHAAGQHRGNPGLLLRLRDRGLVRGGRFVSGFSGEQYALPHAADELARVRKAPRTSERVVVNATDPLNLVGLIVPGATVPAVRTKRVVYVDGIPESADAPVAETA